MLFFETCLFIRNGKTFDDSIKIYTQNNTTNME